MTGRYVHARRGPRQMRRSAYSVSEQAQDPKIIVNENTNKMIMITITLLLLIIMIIIIIILIIP